MRVVLPIGIVLALFLAACSTETTPIVNPTPITPTPVTPEPVVTPPTTVPSTPTPVPTPKSSVEVTPTPTSTPVVPRGITATELAAHNSRTDCWVAYKGTVYDVTAWLPRHPGSVTAISQYCGTADEFTAAFNRQHSTKMEGRLEREATSIGEYNA